MIKTILLLVLMTPWMVLQAAEWYRYINTERVQVTTDTLPPEATTGDYDVVSETGRVLRSVKASTFESAELTEAEKDDDYLLSSFSSDEDIRGLKQRKVLLLVRDIEQLEGTVAALNGREEAVFKQASDIELGGKTVPSALTEQLAHIAQRKDELLQVLQTRRAERLTLEKRYDSYIERFQQLKVE